MSKNLSRRAFLRLCGTTSAGLVLAASGYQLAPRLTAALSAAPTNTTVYLPYLANTCTNPPPVPRPGSIKFQDDFENGLLVSYGDDQQWSVLYQDGGVLSVVPDPTGSLNPAGKPRGNVLKATIQGHPVQYPSWGTNLWWRNILPEWRNGNPLDTVRAPCAIQVDVFKPSDLFGLDLLAAHRLNKKTGDKISLTCLEVYRDDKLTLFVRDAQGKDTGSNLIRGVFKSDQWNTVRLDFETDGSVIPFVNGQNAYLDPNQPLRLPVDSEHDAGFSDCHAGLLAANATPDDGFRDGQFLMNDNFMVLEYLC